jgi:hypothetical protein
MRMKNGVIVKYLKGNGKLPDMLRIFWLGNSETIQADASQTISYNQLCALNYFVRINSMKFPKNLVGSEIDSNTYVFLWN